MKSHPGQSLLSFVWRSNRLCTHCCLSHTHTHAAVDLTRVPTAAAAGLQTKQCNPQIGEKHLCGEERRLQPRSFFAAQHRLGPFITVGNNTTQHLPINPHLSPCHGWLSAGLGLLRDSRFEGKLMWLDVVKKKDVGSGDEALLSQGTLLRRGHRPSQNQEFAHETWPKWPWVSFLYTSRLIWHQPCFNDCINALWKLGVTMAAALIF